MQNIPLRGSAQHSFIIKSVLLFAIYVITGYFGLQLNAVSGFATLVWLPTGVSLAFLLLFGYRLWPVILCGAFVVNLLSGAPVWIAFSIAVGNTLEALVGIKLVHWYGDFHPSLTRLKDVLLLFCAAAISTTISASIGVGSLFIAGIISSESILFTWIAWWIGDIISDFIVAPFVLVWSHPLSVLSRPKRYERIAFFVTLVITGLLVFGRLFEDNLKTPPLTYIVYIPLIWAAVQFGLRTTTLSIAFLSSLAIWCTVKGFGPFVSSNLSESLLYLQSFMGIISISSLMLASAVTERKLIEKRKEEFFSIASHELKTPIATLQAYAQFLEKKFYRKDKKDTIFFSRMTLQIQKIVKLINEMLDLSRIDSNKITYTKKRIDINRLISQTVKEFQYTTNTHPIKKIGKINKVISLDADHIQQVLVNLLTNAVKFSPSGHTVVVHLKQHKSFAQISVQDFGSGIPQKDCKRIFERFYQIHDKTDYQGGFGLGLFIASEIIRNHNGKIWVESIVGKGSTFHFILPYKN